MEKSQKEKYSQMVREKRERDDLFFNRFQAGEEKEKIENRASHQSYLRDGRIWRSIISDVIRRTLVIGTAARNPLMMCEWITMRRFIESLWAAWCHALEDNIVGVVANK